MKNTKRIKANKMILLWLIPLYFILVGNYTLEITTKLDRQTLKYSGVVWVLLDRWLFWRYPLPGDEDIEKKKLFEYSRTEIQE